MTDDAASRSEAARALRAIPRHTVIRTCLQCGTAFEARGRGRYCSEPCKQRAKYQRGKAKKA